MNTFPRSAAYPTSLWRHRDAFARNCNPLSVILYLQLYPGQKKEKAAFVFPASLSAWGRKDFIPRDYNTSKIAYNLLFYEGVEDA
ncbi:MAG: hypothetical protein LUQ15_02990 [Methanothrix sp.]|nr:hypothetical protein [Methanothrix sp.]